MKFLLSFIFVFASVTGLLAEELDPFFRMQVEPYFIIDPVSDHLYVTALTRHADLCEFRRQRDEQIFEVETSARYLHRFDLTAIGLDSHPQSATDRFEIACRVSSGAKYSFQSFVIPSKPSSDEFRAVFITDTQVEPENIGRVMESILQFRPHVVLHAGDIVHSERKIEWQRFFKQYHRLLNKVPLVAAFGDHEFKPDYPDWMWNRSKFTCKMYLSDGRRAAQLIAPSAIQRRRFYGSVRIGPVEVYVLDTNVEAHTLGNPCADPRKVPYLVNQRRWLEWSLEVSRKTHPPPVRLALFHSPPFASNKAQTSLVPYRWRDMKATTIGSWVLSTLFKSAIRLEMRSTHARKGVNYTADDYAFLELTPQFANDVSLVLTGHLHRFERLELDGTPYIVGGPAGKFVSGFFTNDAFYRISDDLRAHDFSTRVDHIERVRQDLTHDEMDAYGRVRVRVPPMKNRAYSLIELRGDTLRTSTIDLESNKCVDDFYAKVNKPKNMHRNQIANVRTRSACGNWKG